MASAANAGTLYIDLVTNLSRLQDEMNQIQRSVGKMSDASGRYIGAVNDNFTRMGTKVSELQGQIERMTGVTGGAMARNQADFDAYGVALDKMRAKYNPLFATISNYKQTLADIRQAHAVGAISADEMSAAITRQRQASLASIAAIKGMTDAQKELAASAALDKLRAQYNPLFAAISNYKQALEGIREAHAAGAISADEMSAAITRERQASLASIAAIKGLTDAQKELAASAELDKLRSKFNPLFATISSYKQVLAEIRQAHAAGAISTDEMSAAIVRERQATLAAIATIKGMSDAQKELNASAALDKLRAQYNPLFAVISSYKQALAGIREAHAMGAISADEMSAAIARERQASLASIATIRGRASAVTQSTGSMKAGMQQLSFQLGDMGAQFGSGTGLMQIFAQQAGQTAQAIGLMTGESKGLIGFIGGPWGQVLIAGATILGTLFLAHNKAADASKAHEQSAEDLTKAIDDLDKATLSQTRSTYASIEASLKDAMAKRATAIETRKAAVAELEAAKAKASAAGASVSPNAPGYANLFEIGEQAKQQAKVKTFQDQIDGLNKAIAQSGTTITTMKGQLIGKYLEEQFDHGAAAAGRFSRTQDRLMDQLRAGAITQRDYAKALREAMVQREAESHADANAAKARRAADKEARDQAREAKKAAKERAEAAKKAAEEEIKMWISVSQAGHAALKGLDASLAGGLDKADQAMRANLAGGMSDWAKAAVDNANANAAWNDQLTETIRMVDQLGEAGRSLGNIGAIFQALNTGNWSPVTGPAGVLGKALGGLTVTSTDKNGDRQIRTLGEVFDGALGKVFGREGSFTKTLQSAGVGMAAGQMFLGSSNSNIGSAIGGAVGEKAGEALTKGMTGILGQLGGPLGSILGGVVGGALGSLLQSTPSGSGKVTNTGVTTSANNDSIRAGLDSFGLGLQQTINKIADQLGGTVGAYDVGIGRYKDYYQISSVSNDLALGHTYYSQRSATALYDGKDPEAAMRAAIAAAIADGAIQGVRAGTQTLLKAGNDIEQQLSKAMKFEGVFNDLKSATDPLGYALDNLTKQFDDLRTIFKEAGATTAEYAQLEQLLAIKRADAVAKAEEQVRQDAVGKVSDQLNLQIKILELLGKTEDSVAAQRLLELAGMKSSLQPLQAMVYQLEDANAIIAKFGPLASDLKAFRDELLGNGTGTGFAALAKQFRTTAALAAGGDATAMGSLRNASNAYLAAAKDNAGSQLDYQRAVAEVLASVDRGIFAADTQVDYAQAQIDAIKNSAAIMQAMREELKTLTAQVADTSAQSLRLWQRFDVDGLTVKADADTPVAVTVVG